MGIYCGATTITRLDWDGYGNRVAICCSNEIIMADTEPILVGVQAQFSSTLLSLRIGDVFSIGKTRICMGKVWKKLEK